jgi:hypothetical protein
MNRPNILVHCEDCLQPLKRTVRLRQFGTIAPSTFTLFDVTAMTYPKKKKGFRTINVEGQEFRWHFRWHFRPCFDFHDSYLTLQGTVSSGEQLIVIMRYPWLAINGFHLTDGGNVFHLHEAAWIVTSKFARTAILHGLANGWKPNDRRPPLFCVYSEGTFSSLTPQREILISPSYKQQTIEVI